ncbi:MAG: hypothetical protein WBW04_20570 [Nitrolancea sp.]
MRVDTFSRCAIAILTLGLFSACSIPGKLDKKAPTAAATTASQPTIAVATAATTVQPSPTPVATLQVTPAVTFVATIDATPESTPEETVEMTPVVSSDVIQVISKGFGQDSASQASYGFIIKNTKLDQALVGWQYSVTAYGADGTVFKTDTNVMPVIFPGEQLGVGNHLFLDDGQTVDHIDVGFIPQTTQPFQQVNDLTTENATFVDDPYFPKVTGSVKNPFNVDLNLVLVSVIAYDSSGNIVGGGFTFLNFVAANGDASIEVGLTTGSPPAKVEMYAMLGDISFVSQ